MPLLIKRIAIGWLLAAAACAAETPADVRDAVDRLEQKALNAPAGLCIGFRVKATQALQTAWPELSPKLAQGKLALRAIGSRTQGQLSEMVKQR